MGGWRNKLATQLSEGPQSPIPRVKSAFFCGPIVSYHENTTQQTGYVTFPWRLVAKEQHRIEAKHFDFGLAFLIFPSFQSSFRLATLTHAGGHGANLQGSEQVQTLNLNILPGCCCVWTPDKFTFVFGRYSMRSLWGRDNFIFVLACCSNNHVKPFVLQCRCGDLQNTVNLGCLFFTLQGRIVH